MNNIRLIFLLILSWVFTRCQPSDRPISSANSSAKTVEIRKEGNGYQLIRNGKPYFIKGAGGYSQYNRLAECGGNSIRVWETADAQRILDRAQELGLTVNLGLWVEREMEGFDYYNQERVEEQLKKLKKVVLQYKDHPALLMWCVGNEWNSAATNIKVFDAVNQIARMVHEVDPQHPVTTTIMLTSVRPIRILKERCPEIDILSINTYGSLHTLSASLKESGWTGPYIISEFGAKGYWETDFTGWDAPIEQTSQEKYAFIKERYEQFIQAQLANCLGSYVFLWGQKQERTPTWFSLFDEEGRETPMVGLMQQLWSGRKPDNEAPRVQRLLIDGQYGAINSFPADTAAAHSAQLLVKDPEGDSLSYRWEILPESTTTDQGVVYLEKKQEPVEGAITQMQGHTIRFRLPSKPGAYRLFAYAYDTHRHVATANVPFEVKEGASRR